MAWLGLSLKCCSSPNLQHRHQISCDCDGYSTGSALIAFGLPLDGGATSKTGQLASYISAFSGIYSAKAADLSTLAGIQDSLNA